MIHHRRFGVIVRVIKRLRLVLLCGSVWMTGTAYANNSDYTSNSEKDLVIGPLQFWEDPSTTATFAQLLARHEQFTGLATTAPNFGFTTSAYWLRIPVENHQAASGNFYLNIENSLIDYTWLNNEGLVFFSELSLTLMLFFAREFLQTHTTRWLDRWLRFFILWTIVQSCGIFLWPAKVAYELTTAMLFVFPLLCLLAGSIAWRQGRTEARFYLIGQAASWIGMFLFGLMGVGVLAYHLLLYQGLAISVVIDAFMLSFALADRIRILQKAQIQAEATARKNLEIHQDELERLVSQRTAEIKTLHGILPICANCKKIRNDQGAWQQLELYISQHTNTAFSHGICADCMTALSPTL